MFKSKTVGTVAILHPLHVHQIIGDAKSQRVFSMFHVDKAGVRLETYPRPHGKHKQRDKETANDPSAFHGVTFPTSTGNAFAGFGFGRVFRQTYSPIRMATESMNQYG